MKLQYGNAEYEVEHVEDENGSDIQVCYILIGPRGARYGLIRNGPNPQRLFAINMKKFTSGTAFLDGWFTDAHGKLEFLG